MLEASQLYFEHIVAAPQGATQAALTEEAYVSDLTDCSETSLDNEAAAAAPVTRGAAVGSNADNAEAVRELEAQLAASRRMAATASALAGANCGASAPGPPPPNEGQQDALRPWWHHHRLL